MFRKFNPSKLADAIVLWIGFAFFGIACAIGLTGYGIYYLFSHITVALH